MTNDETTRAQNAPDAAPAGAESDHAAMLADLQVRHAEVSDAYLRARAEAENTRRRSEDEIAKTRKFALESFAESLLPVKDSLEAAIALQASGTQRCASSLLRSSATRSSRSTRRAAPGSTRTSRTR